MNERFIPRDSNHINSEVNKDLRSSSPNLTSITKGPRQSNFELLRIIAMFLVLIVHADFLSLGAPSKMDFFNESFDAVNKTIVQSFSIICVNIFILISGWFGIKTTLKGFFNFIFQCLFWYILIYAFEIACNIRVISTIDIRKCFFFAPGPGWFVLSYIGLYILSPIMNLFSEHTSKKELGYVLCSFYGLQTFAWLGGGVSFFENGYSTISFLGLYLLGRYLKLYLNFEKPWLLYFVSYIIIISLIYIASTILSININLYAYNNPLVVAGAAFLILWASNMNIKTNKVINWISKSAFAVYLFHCSPFTISYYTDFCKKLYNEYNGIEYITLLGGFIISVFFVSIIIDQFRVLMWNGIINYKSQIKNKKNLVSI